MCLICGLMFSSKSKGSVTPPHWGKVLVLSHSELLWQVYVISLKFLIQIIRLSLELWELPWLFVKPYVMVGSIEGLTDSFSAFLHFDHCHCWILVGKIMNDHFHCFSCWLDSFNQPLFDSSFKHSKTSCPRPLSDLWFVQPVTGSIQKIFFFLSIKGYHFCVGTKQTYFLLHQ